jgi:Transposase DDE domain group 1
LRGGGQGRRSAKDTGLRNLPFHDMAHNRIWVAISALAQDLLAWCARLALPAPAACYEPKRLRLRILAVAGRLVRSARRRILHIDPAWPWANTITTAHSRLATLPVP